MIRVVELLNGVSVIGQIQILEEEPRVCIIDSYIITKLKNGIVLKKYPYYAKENSFLISSSSMLTAYEPSDKIFNMYKDFVTEIYVDATDDDDAIAILNTLFEQEDEIES